MIAPPWGDKVESRLKIGRILISNCRNTKTYLGVNNAPIVVRKCLYGFSSLKTIGHGNVVGLRKW